ncbi:MAG: heme A synthase [Rhodospirillaceae bacterium]|nr:heme A synthase [Rhodospirillaceae bacterium]MBT5459786.1 heme A synthase [Rhodospirillaceae bacterium]
MTSHTPETVSGASIAVGRWLLICGAMVAVMVVLGGATRLTESGLSIVDWRPVTGILPPFSAADWQALFDAYKHSPEFQKANFWMSLADFKTIYWLEYLHRLWGRLIGVVFVVPFIWFASHRQISPGFALHLCGIFVLGALQGLMGWYMVKSGLVDRPSVSQYRLAAHLVLAFIIYGYLVWLALRCLRPVAARPQKTAITFRTHAVVLCVLALITVTAGAFVAGIDAGLAYNTFPLMDGRWVPDGVLRLTPRWINFFENTATVQFTHRTLGISLLVLTLWLWLRVRTKGSVTRARRLVELLAAMVSAQAALGVATLLNEVPVGLGILHQTGALAVFTVAIWVVYELDADSSARAETRRPNNAAPSK